MRGGHGSTSILRNFALVLAYETTCLRQPVASAWYHSAAKASKLRQDTGAASLFPLSGAYPHTGEVKVSRLVLTFTRKVLFHSEKNKRPQDQSPVPGDQSPAQQSPALGCLCFRPSSSSVCWHQESVAEGMLVSLKAEEVVPDMFS